MIKQLLLLTVFAGLATAQITTICVVDTLYSVGSPNTVLANGTLTINLGYANNDDGFVITRSIGKVNVVNGQVNICQGPGQYQIQYRIANSGGLGTFTVYNEVWALPTSGGPYTIQEVRTYSPQPGSPYVPVGNISPACPPGYVIGTSFTSSSVTGCINNWRFVSEFGAVGNGSVDDTAHIQACLNSFAGLAGTCVFSPGTGAYNYTTLNAPQYVTMISSSFVGAFGGTGGPGTTLNCTSTATGNMITLNGRQQVVGFTFSNQGGVQTYGQSLLYVAGNQVSITKNFFRNYYVGIQIGTYPGTVISSVRIEQNQFGPGPGTFLVGSGAIDAENYSQLWISSNEIAGAQCIVSSGCADMSYAIRMVSGYTAKLLDNSVTYHGPGLLFNGPVGSSVFGVISVGNTFDSPDYICTSGTTTCTGTSLSNAPVDIEPAGLFEMFQSSVEEFTSDAVQNYDLYVNPTSTGVVGGVMVTGGRFDTTGTATSCWYFGGLGNVFNVAVNGGTKANCAVPLTITGNAIGNVRISGVYNYNPIGLVPITVTSSPFTYINGSTQATVWITNGTGVSSVVVHTATGDISLASVTQVPLGANESMTVTYSSPTPGMVADVQ